MKTAAPIKWFGGKGRNKKFILENLATAGHCDVFVDAFGGAGNILLNRHPAPCEIYNDLNGYLVNLFRVLRDKQLSKELERMAKNTPYARAEYGLAIDYMNENPVCSKEPNVQAAWSMLVAHNMGFGGKANTLGDWGRTLASANGKARAVASWQSRQKNFERWRQRLSNCLIDNRPAIEVCENYDTPNTLFYLDPPYPLDTRKSGKYEHEMSNEDHEALAEWAKQAKGKVAISTYEHEIYEALGWRKAQKQVTSEFGNSGGLRDGENSRAKNPNLYKRTECLYMNWQHQNELFQ